MPHLTAIIVAAGSSRRMGFDKLTADLDGLPVLRRSIQAFLDCPAVSHIIVVTDEARFHACVPPDPQYPITRVDGGSERHHSVANGLAHVSPSSSFIAVHDGARPHIQPESIHLCLSAAEEHGAASLAHPITETVKRSDADGFAVESVSRDHLWAMETPQIFRRERLLEAYEQVLASGALVTDEVSALEHIEIRTKLVANPSANGKITFPSDL